MKTTERVNKLGLYTSACCNQEVIFEKKDTFTRCPACNRLCDWDLIETLISWRQFEELEEEFEKKAA